MNQRSGGPQVDMFALLTDLHFLFHPMPYRFDYPWRRGVDGGMAFMGRSVVMMKAFLETSGMVPSVCALHGKYTPLIRSPQTF